MSEEKREYNCDCESCRIARLFGEDFADMVMTNRVKEQVREHGWTGMSIMESVDSRPFTYTVGFCNRDKPEIMLVGLPPTLANNFLWCLWDWKEPLTAGCELKVAPNFTLRAVEADEAIQKEMTFSKGYHDDIAPDKPYSVLQLLWPDLKGKYPGEDGFDTVCTQTIEY